MYVLIKVLHTASCYLQTSMSFPNKKSKLI